MKHKIFTSEQIREICKIFVGSNYSLNEEGIKYILSSIKVNDYDPNSPKQNRLFNDLLNAQEITNDGGHILDFISAALEPVNYIDHKDIFTERINQVNIILSSTGIEFRDDGKYYVTKEVISNNVSNESLLNIGTSRISTNTHSFSFLPFINKYKISLLLICSGVLFIILTVITNIGGDNNILDNSSPTNVNPTIYNNYNYTPPTENKNSLSPEEKRIQAKKEAEERMDKDRENLNKRYQDMDDKRMKEIDKMSNIDYYMYHGNPNNLTFEQLEEFRKQQSEDYWSKRKK